MTVYFKNYITYYLEEINIFDFFQSFTKPAIQTANGLVTNLIIT